MVIEKEVKEEIKQVEKTSKKIMKNYWAVSTIILAIVIVLLFSFGNFSSIGKEKAGKKVVDFLNARVGGGVELINVTNQGVIYEVFVSYQSQNIPLYITKDGKNLVQGLVPLTDTNQETIPQNQQQAPVELPKSDKPIVDLYVMSFCPYGNEAEKTMQPVYDLLKNKIDFNVHFIVSVDGTTVQSLHGQKEVDQNEREACVLNESGKDKWMLFASYVNNNCGSDGSCWEDAAKAASLDVNKIKSCVTSKGLNLMKSEAAASDAANANGSPTLIINGVESSSVYQYGDSNAYKETICSACTTAPAECSQELTVGASTTPTGSCPT